MTERESLLDDPYGTPPPDELLRMAESGDPYESAVFELWRGRSIVSSVKAARLTREQADALLRRLYKDTA